MGGVRSKECIEVQGMRSKIWEESDQRNVSK